MIQHPIAPIYDEKSRILILGSFPSVQSRNIGFYYGNPQNRFWYVLAALTKTDIPKTTEEKRTFLLAKHIAVWDVVKSCEIVGSSDESIRNVQANDLSPIFSVCDIQQIYTNGKKADMLYRHYMEPIYSRKTICLPSTSPANAAWNLERLTDDWRVILLNLN